MSDRPTSDLTAGVAVRLSSLCLDSHGRVSELLICSTAVRGGLLVDLALAGRVESTEESVVVDETPTGFAPADRLLAAIAAERERSLDGWLDERRIGLKDLAVANVADGRWELRRGLLPTSRRYRDLQQETTDRARVRVFGDGAEAWTPVDAAVTAIAMVTGLLDKEQGMPEEPPVALLSMTGPAQWLCTAVVDHLRVTAARYRVEATGLSPF